LERLDDLASLIGASTNRAAGRRPGRAVDTLKKPPGLADGIAVSARYGYACAGRGEPFVS
jgi:hypothetical protein